MRFWLLLLLSCPALFAGSFLDAQIACTRVKNAQAEKMALVEKLFSAQKLSLGDAVIFIRAFKREAIVELWARRHSAPATPYSLIRTYDICSSSGTSGPKRKRGDGQVPEGVYAIDRFNPWSSFHLSLGINYPNGSDKILGRGSQLGGDIFIHGSCVTIGCIPIEDESIKELYLICVYARDNGQKTIPVHIFPLRMDGSGMNYLMKVAPSEDIKTFWRSLEPVYAAFESTRRIPHVSVGEDGYYRVR